MTPDAFYGSSEYSPEAEELFARFVREDEAGTAPDFDTFCAQHEARADELYGLHADWDNVRGLIARLEQTRARSEPVVESIVETVLEPAPHSSTAVEPDPLDVSAARPKSVWVGVAVLALALAGGLGGWAWSLVRAREVQAREQSAGLAREEAARIELAAARKEGRSLAQRESELELELATTTETVTALEGHNQTLVTERDAERALAEEARREAEHAAVEAAQLTALVTLADLIAREDTLWPTTPERGPALAAWLDEAEALAARFMPGPSGGPELDVRELQLEPAQVTRVREQLAFFGPDGRDGGLLTFTRERLVRLDAWTASLTGEGDSVAERWDAVHQAVPAGAPARTGRFTPLRTHPVTGLWIFADADTGDVPVRDDDGAWSSADGCALLFVLVPGSEPGAEAGAEPGGNEVGGGLEPGFLLGLEAPSAAHLQRALGPHFQAADDVTAWTRLGYEVPTRVQRELAERGGIELAPDSVRPACRLDLQR